jgi:hypothetical protein
LTVVLLEAWMSNEWLVLKLTSRIISGFELGSILVLEPHPSYCLLQKMAKYGDLKLDMLVLILCVCSLRFVIVQHIKYYDEFDT